MTRCVCGHSWNWHEMRRDVESDCLGESRGACFHGECLAKAQISACHEFERESAKPIKGESEDDSQADGPCELVVVE